MADQLWRPTEDAHDNNNCPLGDRKGVQSIEPLRISGTGFFFLKVEKETDGELANPGSSGKRLLKWRRENVYMIGKIAIP